MTATGRIRDTLRELVGAHRSGGIVVDLDQVTFIDSEAIGAIIAGHKAAATAGIALRLRHAHGMVHRVFDILGLLAMFDDAAAEPEVHAQDLDLLSPADLTQQAAVTGLPSKPDGTPI